jgi:hypothetical protein
MLSFAPRWRSGRPQHRSHTVNGMLKRPLGCHPPSRVIGPSAPTRLRQSTMARTASTIAPRIASLRRLTSVS